ncbi:MAG: methylated-DNA--[protein]-cysteine S-methyltransferase [Euryarchaeota archaeon]|nr:methylated-DNA--[protein]-cysteine S-methyltransferase [Euryarchaeota archaeon]
MEILGGAPRGTKPLPLDLELDYGPFTPFQKRVSEKAREIPPGKVATYGELASAAGAEGGARAVGQVMAENPFPIIVPCHRVIRSDRTIGGYFYGQAMKVRLLEREGVRIERGKVKREDVFRWLE